MTNTDRQVRIATLPPREHHMRLRMAAVRVLAQMEAAFIMGDVTAAATLAEHSTLVHRDLARVENELRGLQAR